MGNDGGERSRVGRRRGLASIALACGLIAGTAASAGSTPSDPWGPDDVVYDLAEVDLGDKPNTLSARLAELASKGLRDESNADQADAVGLRARGAGSLIRDGERLVVSARVTEVSDALLERLRGAGADVIAPHPDFGTVDLAVDEADLRAVAAVEGVESATEALAPIVNGSGIAQRSAEAEASGGGVCPTGSLISEADTQMRAAEARATYGISGAGTKVGVISDSYDTRTDAATRAAQDVASGDLPGPGNPCKRRTPVQVLHDFADKIDEGRAMIQLVHDLAPNAGLAFATSFPTAENMADNIRGLRAAGSTVIVDDISYLNEPMYQDGPISVAVNEVTAAGVPYYSSAANSNIISQVPGISGTTGQNIGSYEAPAFRSGAACLGGGSNCMDFHPGATVDSNYQILLGAGRSVTLVFNWAQARGAVTTDLDIFAFDVSGPSPALAGQSIDDNLTTQQPLEVLRFQNPSGGARLYDVVINRFVGGAPRLKFVALQSGGIAGVEYDVSFGGDTVGPTIFGHNGAENAVSTAAVPFDNASTLETFSSRGPVTILFTPGGAPLPAPQVLAKPDISATDNTSTTFFQPLGDGTFRFSGTSAAAPHAAAVAALQQDAANGAISVAQVRANQAATAAPVGPFGVNAAGAGLVNAVGAVGASPPQPPDTVITKEPKNKTPKSKVTYKFVSNAAEATFSCKIDNGRFQKCASPVKVVRLPFGRHQFTVKAKANGLVDGSPDKDRFKRRR